jgi:hypothetical protein
LSTIDHVDAHEVVVEPNGVPESDSGPEKAFVRDSTGGGRRNHRLKGLDT